MSNVLYLNVPMHAHVNPTLPLVAELVRRGERITYFATEPFRAAVERAGSHFRAYEGADFSYYDKGDGILFNHAAVLMEAAEVLLPRLLDDARGAGVDYIVHDSLCPWGRYLGELLRVPTVSTSITFSFHPLVFANLESIVYAARTTLPGWGGWRRFRRASASLAASYGVHGRSMWQVVTNKAALNLVFTSEAMQPFRRFFDDTYRFVGASVGSVGPGGDELLAGAGDKPVVFVSLGTSFNARPDFFRTCIEALRAPGYHVVMAIGHRVRREELGPIPDHVVVAPFVPQLAVLRRARLFLCHAGMSSVNESLSFGVPVLMYPQTVEGRIGARRVASLAAGRILSDDEVRPSSLRALIDGMVRNDGCTRAAVALGESFRAAGGHERAADEIARFKERAGVR